MYMYMYMIYCARFPFQHSTCVELGHLPEACMGSGNVPHTVCMTFTSYKPEAVVFGKHAYHDAVKP